jgi:hypothetical protein
MRRTLAALLLVSGAFVVPTARAGAAPPQISPPSSTFNPR